MVKQQLVNALVKVFPGISKQDMLSIVDALFESMAQALMKGETVELRGLCRLRIKERGPAKGRNPKTRKPVSVPKRWMIHFKAAESLSRQINRTDPDL